MRQPGLCACVRLSVGGEGAHGEKKKSNPPRALHTSPFASQMFPRTLDVGGGQRRVESFCGFNWLAFEPRVRIIMCMSALCLKRDAAMMFSKCFSE